MPSRLSLLSLLLLIVSHSNAGDFSVAPDWRLQTSAGEAFDFSDAAQDQTTVLLFWASWCPYCKALMPHLQSIVLEYGGDVQVVAVNFRDDGDPAAYVEEQGFDFILLLDGGDVAERYGIWATPGLLLVDGERRIRFDLRDLEPPAAPDGSHRRKAAFRAPYWAAEIRRAIDIVLDGKQTPPCAASLRP